jgi:hypothetical protein
MVCMFIVRSIRNRKMENGITVYVSTTLDVDIALNWLYYHDIKKRHDWNETQNALAGFYGYWEFCMAFHCF